MGFAFAAKSTKLDTSKDTRLEATPQGSFLSIELSLEETDMRTMMTGFSGWVRMQDNRNESVKVLDTMITVVATLLVAVTWAVLR